MSKSRNYTLCFIYFVAYYEIIKLPLFEESGKMVKIILNSENYLCHYSFAEFGIPGYMSDSWIKDR